MKPVKPPRINGRVPVLSAQEAVNYIPDEALMNPLMIFIKIIKLR